MMDLSVGSSEANSGRSGASREDWFEIDSMVGGRGAVEKEALISAFLMDD
jgi:hypothetical protein